MFGPKKKYLYNIFLDGHSNIFGFGHKYIQVLVRGGLSRFNILDIRSGKVEFLIYSNICLDPFSNICSDLFSNICSDPFSNICPTLYRTC